MIFQVDIRNFQSHKNSILQFSKGVNCIVGSSDSGKSAILRAINWVVNNRPSGESFKRRGQKETEVYLHTTEDISIFRTKSDKDNKYTLIQEEEENKLEAVGRDVPTEIEKAINMNSVNIQYQMDAPFLLSESSGEVARYLSKVVDLEVIHESMKKVDKIKRQAKSKREAAEEAQENLKNNLKNIPNISRAEELLHFIETQQSILFSKQKDYSAITATVEDLQYIKTKLSSIPDIKKAEKIFDKINSKRDERQALQFLYEELVHLIEDIEESENKLSSIPDIVKAEKILNKTEAAIKKLQDSEKEYEKIKSIIDSVDSSNKKMKSIKGDLAKMEKEFKQLFPNICPLCGQEVN